MVLRTEAFFCLFLSNEVLQIPPDLSLAKLVYFKGLLGSQEENPSSET